MSGTGAGGGKHPSFVAKTCRREPEFSGPAIVEQLDTTTVIEPECDVCVDAAGNLVVTVGALAEDWNGTGS